MGRHSRRERFQPAPATPAKPDEAKPAVPQDNGGLVTGAHVEQPEPESALAIGSIPLDTTGQPVQTSRIPPSAVMVDKHQVHIAADRAEVSASMVVDPASVKAMPIMKHHAQHTGKAPKAAILPSLQNEASRLDRERRYQESMAIHEAHQRLTEFKLVLPRAIYAADGELKRDLESLLASLG